MVERNELSWRLHSGSSAVVLVQICGRDAAQVYRSSMVLSVTVTFEPHGRP